MEGVVHAFVLSLGLLSLLMGLPPNPPKIASSALLPIEVPPILISRPTREIDPA